MRVRKLKVTEGKAVNISQFPNFSATGSIKGMKEKGVDYQNRALFVAQDIDRITGLMCFIQLSLLGCAGYVVIADTLCNPIVGKTALFIEEQPEQEIWFLPMFFNEIWDGRKKWNFLDLVLQGTKVKA